MKYINFRKQFKTARKQYDTFAIALDLSLWNFENEGKHTKTQLIFGNHSQKLVKFCFINPMVSLEEVVNRGTLFEEVHEQTGVAEDSKNINEIKNLEKNEPSLQIQLKLLQEQINELKSVEKSKTKTQEYINRRTEQKPCFKCS